MFLGLIIMTSGAEGLGSAILPVTVRSLHVRCEFECTAEMLCRDGKGKGKAVPLQACTGPEGSRKLPFWRRNYFLNFSTPCT